VKTDVMPLMYGFSAKSVKRDGPSVAPATPGPT
jgi:hypothetical protein